MIIQNNTKLNVYDNSGISIVKCFKNLKFKNNNNLNRIIKISVKEVKSQHKSSVKCGQIYNALVIKSKYNLPRFNGQKITFETNGCIIIDNINFKNKKTRNKLTLIGSNVMGVALKEFRIYSIKLNINAINIL